MRSVISHLLVFTLAMNQLEATPVPATNRAAALPAKASPQQIETLIRDLRVYETRVKAVKPLIEAGPEAVPKLVQAYGATDDAFVKLTISVIVKAIGAPAAEPLIAAWGNGNSDAAALLLMLGTNAKSALPLAMRELNQEDAARAVLAAMVLGAIGPDASPAVPTLLSRLKGDESWLSTQCAEAMTNIGRPGIDKAIDPLIEMVRKRERAWDAAARVLGSVRAKPDTVVPLIAAALDADENRGSGFSAMLALRDYGQAAGPAIPVLIRYTSRDKADEPTSDYAAEAIARVYPEGVAALRDLLKNKSDAARIRSIRALGSVRHRAMTALPELLANADHANPKIRSLVAHVIGRMGYAGAPGVPKLAQLLADPDDEVKFSAAYALGDLGPWSASAVPALRRMIGASNPDLHLGAIRALGRIGPHAVAALPDLIAILDRRDRVSPVASQFAYEEMRDVLNSLGKMQESAAPASGRLAAIVRLSNDNHSNSAIVALGQIGARAAETSPDVIPALIQAIDRKQSALAAGTLFRMEASARPAVPGLLQMLKSNDPEKVTIAAIALMGVATPADPAVLTALDALRTRPESHVRMAATVAAAKLRGDTRAAVAAAVAHLADASVPVAERHYAFTPLQHFGAKALIGIPKASAADLDSFLFQSYELLFEMALIDPDARKAVETMIADGSFEASEWAARQRHFKK